MIEEINGIDCSWYEDCIYYKQLKRLEKENEELKNRKDDYYVKTLDQEAQISDLIQENEELKFYIDSYRQVWEVDKYRHALEEIMEIVNSVEYYCELPKYTGKIKDIINKALESEEK